ncbi:hypothetical protein [Micromonospora sp. SL4-19]|uniref:hypothetical protein n=1 Tax=Micromonospora sp. SL4-19 TaxID=3399129 RepID=UPI003A4D2949
MFFLIYDLLLLLGGIAMVVTGLAIREQGKLARVLNVVVGLAFFCYGFYLMFLFEGGEYRIFIYVFVLPVLLIVRAVKARKQAREEAAAQQVAGPAYPDQGQYGQAPQPGYPAQPGQAPQPGYPAQPGYPVQPGQPAPQGQPGHPTA